MGRGEQINYNLGAAEGMLLPERCMNGPGSILEKLPMDQQIRVVSLVIGAKDWDVRSRGDEFHSLWVTKCGVDPDMVSTALGCLEQLAVGDEPAVEDMLVMYHVAEVALGKSELKPFGEDMLNLSLPDQRYQNFLHFKGSVFGDE
jgi:hypothetical protein